MAFRILTDHEAKKLEEKNKPYSDLGHDHVHNVAPRLVYCPSCMCEFTTNLPAVRCGICRTRCITVIKSVIVIESTGGYK